MADSETLEKNIRKNDTETHGDFPSIGVDMIKKINFKVAIFLFIVGIFVFSDIFIENLLPKTMVDGYCADTKGTAIQLLIFILFYLVIDLLVQGCVI